MTDIYTDGSCLGNPGPGGWAAILMSGEEPLRLSGGEPATTNNRMELTAAIEGLEAVSAGSVVTVYSDSTYLVNTMTRNWKRNANHDLWQRLDQLRAERQVQWGWVKGHNGHPLNEEADRLAVAAMQGFAAKGRASARPEPVEGRQRGSTSTETDRPSLTHLDAQGKARMVDVGGKPATERVAVAQGVVAMKTETLALVLQGQMEKGDVFTVARVAGITAAKRTWDLVPLAHQVPLSQVAVEFTTDAGQGLVTITATAKTTAATGVEMEALTAVAVSALTIYDMCKAVDRAIVIRDVRLLEKRGGQRGDYVAPP